MAVARPGPWYRRAGPSARIAPCSPPPKAASSPASTGCRGSLPRVAATGTPPDFLIAGQVLRG